MNAERLLREVESRLQGRDQELREAVLDALREAIARERRWIDPSPTIEAERQRRVEAEEMREIVEAVGRPASMHAALAEALKQTARVIELDVAVVLSHEPGAGFRVEAARGPETGGLADTLLSDSRLVALAESRQPTSVSGTSAEEAPVPLPLAAPLAAWAAVPMLHEGKRVGLFVLGRQNDSAFAEEDLLRAKRIAFTAAAVLARGRQLQQVRRYAVLLEQLVEIDQRVFGGEPLETLGQAIVEGACLVGHYRGGLLVLRTPRGLVVGAAVGEAFLPAVGRPAPADLASAAPRRLGPERMIEAAESLGVSLPAGQTFLVPLAAPDAYIGCLALLDPVGPGPEDRLIEAFASRSAAAWRFAARQLRS